MISGCKKLSTISSCLSFLLFLMFISIFSVNASAQENSDCLMCHEDKTLTGQRDGKIIHVYVDVKKLEGSVHKDVDCVSCHADLQGTDFPHKENVAKAQCVPCHEDEQQLYAEGIHGRESKKGDPLAPVCQSCHGSHDIIPIKNINSAVAPIKIPFVCGSCHKEGTKVQVQRHIPQDHILENYSESIHGEGLLKKGLAVAANCASCHSPHRILPPDDSRSTISRKNIAATCTKCHQEIEVVHRKIINGKLWESKPHVLPACVDCHPPHKIRNVFYAEGAASQDCLNCHGKPDIKSSDGRSLYVNAVKLQNSVHSKISCSQCHTKVNPSLVRPCKGITKKVDCSACHEEVGQQYIESIHGQLFAQNNPNAPTCMECHGSHGILGKKVASSPIFPANIPSLCAKCHRKGEKAAVRYVGPEHDIVENYTESIHGKGLVKSGLMVTATCTDCHTAHHELPHDDPRSSINRKNIASTCGHCHYGIQEQFVKSVHSPTFDKDNKKPLPVCNDCHTAHKISRIDAAGFRLQIMNTCGRCHEKIAETYFDTFHGQVSKLGYAKTAKCFDCHGAHDILPVDNPKSHVSHENIVQTCQNCHEGATRKFAGYFTHATHHDPVKYPILYWTFRGMTGLLVITFLFAGVHTLLWLPRSLQWRRELKRRNNLPEIEPADDDKKDSDENNSEES